MNHAEWQELCNEWERKYTAHPTISFDRRYHWYLLQNYQGDYQYLYNQRRHSYEVPSKTEVIRFILPSNNPTGHWENWDNLDLRTYVYEDPTFEACLQFVPYKKFQPLIAPLLITTQYKAPDAPIDRSWPAVHIRRASYYRFFFLGDEGYHILQHYLNLWETEDIFRKALLLPPKDAIAA